MTVESYLRSLVIGLDLPDEVLERCARSPIEVGLDPLDLDEDIDAVRNGTDGNPGDNPDAGDGGGTDDVTTPDTPVAGGERESGGEDGPDGGDTDKETDFQMRLDYASSSIYYSVLGVFSGGGYSEQVGDVKVSRSSYIITMADRERFKRLGDMLRRKWGWDVEDEDVNGIMDVSILRSVIP